MKNLSILCLSFICIGFVSCKKNQNQQGDKDDQVQTENLINTKCYKALYQKDTIDLKINTLQNGKITGTMVMNVFNKPKMIGDIAGEFRGDTLICAYTYILEKDKKITHKNPMAFLKQGNGLVLGNGKIDYNLGQDTLIDFDHAKYKFTNVECVDKN